MRWRDLTIKKDNTGVFLEFQERATKTRTGEHTDTRDFIPRAYANEEDPTRCPTALYQAYSMHRPVSMLQSDTPFYLAVNNMLKDMSKDRSWYKTSSIGVNTIGSFVKTMSKAAGLTGKYTNHSVRRTSVTNLLRAGVPPTLIQQVSGHKDVKSISNYGSASREQIRDMNRILLNPQAATSYPIATVSSAAAATSYPTATVSSAVTAISYPTATMSSEAASIPQNTEKRRSKMRLFHVYPSLKITLPHLKLLC